MWGIGYERAQKCWADGIHTAAPSGAARDSWIKQVLTIAGLNTVNELRGVPSIGETLAPSARKEYDAQPILRSESEGHKDAGARPSAAGSTRFWI